MKGLYFFLLLGWLLPVTCCLAAEPAPLQPQATRLLVNKVMQSEDFGKKVTYEQWVPKEKKKAKPAADSWWSHFLEQLADVLAPLAKLFTSLLAGGVQAILWCLLALCVGLLSYLIYRNRHTLAGGRRIRQSVQPPAVLFGLELDPESLPDDVVAEANRLLTAGKFRDTMSLLYRGALSRLVHQQQVHLKDSFTEYECVAAIKIECPRDKADFFATLTNKWVQTAYGHHYLNAPVYAKLIAQWQLYFAKG